MEFFFYCILAIGSGVVMGFPSEQSMLRQVQLEFINLNKHLMHEDKMLHTPLIDEIEDCCSLNALRCFVKSLPQLKVLSTARKIKTTFIKNLQKKSIESSVRTCSETETENAVCKACESYQKRSSREFMDSLEMLLKKTRERLS